MAVIKTMVFMTRLVLTNYTKHKHMEPLVIFYHKHINEVVGFILVICEKEDKSVGKRGPDMSESSREIRHIYSTCTWMHKYTCKGRGLCTAMELTFLLTVLKISH